MILFNSIFQTWAYLREIDMILVIDCFYNIFKTHCSELPFITFKLNN